MGYKSSRLVDLYRSELDHTYSVRASLESKATTHMQIIGIIMGLYGTISTVFFISRETLDLSKISFLFILYIITSAITAFFMIGSLLVSIFVIKIKAWYRPNYNDLVFGTNEKNKKIKQITSDQVSDLLKNGDKNLIDSRIITTLAATLLMNRKNNKKITDLIKKSHEIIIVGLFSFLTSLVFLIIIGIQINI